MIDVVMPQMGESLAEGTVVRWLKVPGDRVARDEPLFEISTDKVDTDVPSPTAGVLKEIVVSTGQTVSVGATVARIEPDAPARAGGGLPTSAVAAGAGPATAATAAAAAADNHAAAEPAGGHFKSSHAPQLVAFRRGAALGAPRGATGAPGSASVAPRPPAGSTAVPRFRSSRPLAAPPASRTFTPAVLATAQRGGLSLDTLTTMAGSGRDGRITKRDVEEFVRRTAGVVPAIGPASGPRSGAGKVSAGALAAAPPAVPAEYLYRPTAEDQIVEMSTMRRKIAHHMSWSTRISPHASAFADCDMTRASAILNAERERFVEQVGAPLTYTVLAADALVRTLREFPVFNASVVGDALILKPRVHLGIAVALADTDDLIVPVIHDADGLSLAGLARALADLAGRARARKLTVEDVQGGTFTLTNPGMFGGLTGTPLLNQPQVGIVGLGAIAKRAVVLDDDRIAPRPMMTVSLTFDHRAADGMAAFRFLDRLRQRLEAGPDELNASAQ